MKIYLATEQQLRDIFRRGANIDPGESMVKLESAVMDAMLPEFKEAGKDYVMRKTKLELFVSELATQRIGSELPEEEYKDADFEGAWESIVVMARTLSGMKP